MKTVLNILVALCAALALSGCYNHKTSFASGVGHVNSLPARMMLAGEDGKTAYLLEMQEVGYRLNGGNGHAKLVPIDGGYWVETSQIGKKSSKREFTSYAVRMSRGRAEIVAVQPETVTSKSDLVRRLTADLRDPSKKGEGFKILNLALTGDRQEAQAFLAAAERAQKEKKAEKTTPKAKTAPAPERAGQFAFVAQEDVMTGETKQFIYGFPKDGEWGKPPFIRLGCYGAGDQYPVGVTIAWGASLYDLFPQEPANAAQVTARFGQNAPIELGWSVSGNFAETYPPDPGLKLGASMTTGIAGMFLPKATISQMRWNWGPELMHQAFRSYDQVALRGYPRSGQEITMIFDTKGFREVLGNFRPHCQRR